MRVTLRRRIRFYQQLAVLVRAGVSIRTGLQRLKERIGGNSLTILTGQIGAGEKIGDAFAAAGFSPMECHLIVAGERSGQLDTIFEHLGEYWQRQLQMRQDIRRPLYYPVFVLHLALLVGALVEHVYSPGPAVLVHLVERFVLMYGAAILLYLAVRLSWPTELGRRFWFLVPIIGGALRSVYAYRWVSTLKLEFSAGISLPNAVADAWRASDYVGCNRLAEESQQALWRGETLSALMRNWRQLPRDWVDFIETGEVSGALDGALTNLEAEALRNWRTTQQIMADWLPKILYFVVMIIAAIQIFSLLYQVEVAPLENVEKEIDNAR
jgi:type IV pilus assembly protein PilC